MAMISDFLIKIQVQGQAAVDKFKSSVDNVDKSVNKLNGSGGIGKLQGALKGLGDTFSSVASTGNNFADGMIGSLGRMGGAASVAFAAVGAAVVGLGMKAITVADQLQDLADATGFTASEVLSFKQSVIAAGGDVDGFEKILAKLNQSTQEAAAGNQKMQQAFKDMGVYVTDANGEVRESGDILADIIKRYQDGEITAKEYAASIDLMGKLINRLDLEKLKAVNDPFKNEEIAQLAAYQSAIDSLVASVENKLIAAFGRLAIYINNARKQAASLDQEAASRGKVRTDIFGVSEMTGSTPASNRFYTYERDMTPAEKAAYKKQQAAINSPPIPNIPKGNLGPRGGGFGAAPAGKGGGGGGGKSDAQREAEQRKEALESARRTTQELIQQNKEANQLRQIGIDVIGLDSDRANLIRANAQAQSKAAQEIRALETKIAEERDKGKKANTGVIEELQKQVVEKNAQIAATEKLNQLEYERTIQLGLQKNALEYQKQLIDLMGQSENDRLVAAEREKLIKGEISERELDDKSKLIAAETTHKTAMLRLDQELADAKKRQDTVQIDSINNQISVEQKRHEQTMKNIQAEIDFEKKKQSSSAAGARAAIESIKEQFSEYNVAQMQTNALWNNMSNALDNFVDTGKLKFGDLARSIISDIAKIALKAAVSKIFTMIGGSIFGKAAGGPVMANKPYVVGEQGPELFVPNSAGSIMTNASMNKNSGGGSGVGATVNNTYITNNISAIDSRSVAQMFVENRKSLLGASVMARKEMPYGN